MDQRKQKCFLLLLDGGRLLCKGILQHLDRDIDEILSDNMIHTRVRELRDSRRISDEHYHLMFPPTDLSQWDATITTRFLEDFSDLDEPKRAFIDELRELRDIRVGMYQKQDGSDEEYTSVWKRILNILEKGQTFFTGTIVREIDEIINRITQEPITPGDIDRIKSWYDSETKYAETDTLYPVLHGAAFHGKLQTLKYIKNEFPGQLYEQDTYGNQAVHLAAEGGHIDCLRYLIDEGLDPYLKNRTQGHTIMHKAIMGNCVEIVEYICQEYPALLAEPDDDDCMPIHIAATRNPDIGRCLINSGADITSINKQGMNALHIAASEGSVDFIRNILNEDDESLQTLLQAQTNDGMSLGHVAVNAGYLNCLGMLVAYGIDPMAKSDKGSTLLHTAAREGFLYLVKYISEKFPELKNETDEKGMHALFSATHAKSPDCLKYLISQGLDTDMRSKYGDTLLHEAAFKGFVPMVRYIWETFPEFRYAIDDKGMDALHTAVLGGSLNCVKYLIDQGMKPDTQCMYGSTIMHEASYKGYMSIVRYILENFPELMNVRNKDGHDALQCAAIGGSVECVKYLIDRGMAHDTRSKRGNTLLHVASGFGDSVSMVQYLSLTFPELKKLKNWLRQDALHCAAQGGKVYLLQYLINKGLQTYSRCIKGSTILHQAAYGGSVSMVQYIWETFPDLNNERNSMGQDALYMAALGGSLDCLTYLIGQGINTDTRSTDKGYTILHAAAMNGHDNVVRYLYTTNRFLIPLKSFEGETAADLARRNRENNCLMILED